MPPPPPPLLHKSDTSAIVRDALEASGGILLAARATVCRQQYNGRDVLAPNSRPEYADARGYVPVERWILSKTMAENAILVEGEGVSRLLTPKGEVRLDVACRDRATDWALFGPYSKHWPLTKVLDIGGVPQRPSFAGEGGEEVPPIPCHVHPGAVRDGRCCMRDGKLEAYFFPPVGEGTAYAGKVPDEAGVITRLGLKPGTTREEVRRALDGFGRDDSLYKLMQVYPVRPNTSWTIQPGVLHAPGPWPTFEIQRAQDDSHLLAWKLGQPVEDPKALSRIWSQCFANGLPDADAVLREGLHLEASADPRFEEKWLRPCEPLAEGPWGRRRRIFHHEFDGEGFEILPGQAYEHPARDEPYAALVWSGRGDVRAVAPGREFPAHGVEALTDKSSEFLVTPRTAVRMANTSATDTLYIYTVLPISATKSYFVAPEDWTG